MIEIVEEFRPVEGTDGRYMISNRGNVLSVYARRNVNGKPSESYMPRLMKPTDNGHGYLIFSTRIRNVKRNHYVHREVAKAFLERQDGKNYVNHIDYNTRNNNVENLEWCTQKENILHSKPNVPKQHKTRPSKATGERYIGIDKKGLYRVCIKGKCDKRFAKKEDAVEYRNKVVYEIGYSI